ncbi:MAG: tryptophan-rich sensory protein [Clostridia bacterium]|nr:tryptophan-rich sensory protein [Clostridia bacterium]
MNEKTKDRIITYVIAIAIPLGVGALSALLSREGMELYSTITKPPLSPPAIVFPIAWSILYLLMGISSGMIWERRLDCEAAVVGLRNYAISLGLNFFWSIIFFNLGAFLLAFVWLLALAASVIATAVSYRRVYPPAALLQIPYILWLLFAAYLNLGVYVLN